MKTRILLIILLNILLLDAVRVVAQEDEIKAPTLAVKWSPVHLMYFYPSVQIALEHRIYKDLSIQYDLGYVIGYSYNDSEEYSNRRGLRFIGELRYYVPHPPKVPFYVAAEYYYNKINFDRSEVAGYDCGDGDCSYFEYIQYKVENRHEGVGLKFGLLLYPGWNKNKSVFFDLNAGAAFRNITYENIGKPSGDNIEFFDNDDSTPFSPSEQNGTRIRLIIGIRIGYRFF